MNTWVRAVASAHPIIVTLIVAGSIATSPSMLVSSALGATHVALFYGALSAWLWAVHIAASQARAEPTEQHASRSGWLFVLPGPLIGLGWIANPGTDFHIGAEALNAAGLVSYLVCAWKTAEALEAASATPLRPSNKKIFATFALLVWVVPGAWALRGRILSVSSPMISAGA